MKKLLLNTLILVSIIGIFNSASQASAQFGVPKGTCFSTAGIKYDVPESDCTGFGKNWKQTSDGSSVDTTTGSCATNNGFSKVYGVTHTNCSSPGVWTPGETPPDQAFSIDNTHYTLLAPLPNLQQPLDVSGNAALGKYLNIIINLIIGISAVLAVVMIVMGGVQYMTSELISTKEAGKNRITSAVLGLILALGSYLLLNTINPDLLKTDFSSVGDVTVNIAIQDFQISGPLTRSPGGTPIKVNFNTEAYPAAKNAENKTGVDTALTLAIFAQESGSGINSGACLANDPKAKMKDADKVALQTIVGGDISNINVSCAGSSGYGGAIGYTQFLPTTWLRFKDKAAGFLGHQPDPWNVNDALMMTAIYLQTLGGASSPYNAACSYFGKCSYGGVDYADQVVRKMESIKQQIADAIKNGKVAP